jgi:hypothetical protein
MCDRFVKGISLPSTRRDGQVPQLIEGARDGQQIEMRYFELSRLSRSELARRGLHRPCELHELMSQHFGSALDN